MCSILKIKDINENYEKKISGYVSILENNSINYNNNEIATFPVIEKPDQQKDDLMRRMAIIGMIMVWEDYVLDIYELYNDQKIFSVAIKEMRERKGSFNCRRYLERFDYIRFYRNHVLHNNCKKDLERKDDWECISKERPLIKNEKELSIDDNAIRHIFESIRSLKNEIDKDLQYGPNSPRYSPGLN
jgi:Leucine-rich repeat (LRR) protein